MSRIAESFAGLKREQRRGFIPFITAGDPDLKTTRELIIELAHVGATVIELGVPFSDPMADGPVIQRASERALRHGFGLAEVLQTVAEARNRRPDRSFQLLQSVAAILREKTSGRDVRAPSIQV
jgi:Tryptophan synthase alpha chain